MLVFTNADAKPNVTVPGSTMRFRSSQHVAILSPDVVTGADTCESPYPHSTVIVPLHLQALTTPAVKVNFILGGGEER